MFFGIPASGSGVDFSKDGAIKALLSYCDEVGVDCVSIGPPMRDGKPDAEALIQMKETPAKRCNDDQRQHCAQTKGRRTGLAAFAAFGRRFMSRETISSTKNSSSNWAVRLAM